MTSLAKFFFLISLISTGVFAQAEDTAEAPAAAADASAGSGILDTEYFHQADGGVFEVSPYLKILGMKERFRNETTKSNYGALDLGSKVEYGLAPWISVGLDLAYSVGGVSYEEEPSGTTYKDYTVKGFRDPEIYSRARIRAGPGVVNLMAAASTSLEKAKEDADGDLNAASGGTVATLGAGYSVGLGSHKFGGGVAYDIYQSGFQNKSSTASFKTKGGNSLSVTGFYEFSFPKLASIGAAVEYLEVSTTKSNQTGTYASLNSESRGFSVSVYGPLRFTDRITLVPSLMVGGQKYTSKSYGSKDASVSGISCMGRFAF